MRYFVIIEFRNFDRKNQCALDGRENIFYNQDSESRKRGRGCEGGQGGAHHGGAGGPFGGGAAAVGADVLAKGAVSADGYPRSAVSAKGGETGRRGRAGFLWGGKLLPDEH